MWIERDFSTNFDPPRALECLYIKGPRQIGKTSVLVRLLPKVETEWFLDDLMIRERAKKDPEFLISQSKLPVLIDEAHLAPEIFFSIKKKVDELRRERMKGRQKTLTAIIRLTGSNLYEINTSVQESLAGRVSIVYLHGLSFHEVFKHNPKTLISEYLFKGGFPELWVRPELSPIQYINDYISTFIEKDLARSIGIEKKLEFLSVLRLLAARVGSSANFESLGNDANIRGKTVKDWVSLLQENKILYILEAYSSNLNKRLIKMPKIYFMDLGICTRLQSHPSQDTILQSPQAGALFECMVISEIVKTKDHFQRDWNLHYYRTKEKEEIDLILETESRIFLAQIKLGTSSLQDVKIPRDFLKSKKKISPVIITASGKAHWISKTTECIPLQEFVERALSYQIDK